MAPDRKAAATVTGQTLSSIAAALLIVGSYSAVFWKPGIYLALAGFLGVLAFHLAVGIIGYRMTMSRPWPEVPPLEDDDDW